MGSTVVVPVLGSLQLGDGSLLMTGRSTYIGLMVGQGLTVLAVGAGRDCSDIFFLSPIISLFSPSLWNEWVGNLWFKSFSTEF